MGKWRFLVGCLAFALVFGLAKAQDKKDDPPSKNDKDAEKKDAPPDKKDKEADKKDAAPAKKDKEAEKKEPELDGKKLSEWLTLLKDKDNKERGKAATAIATMGSKARPANAALVEMLKDEKDLHGRQLSAYVLTYIRPDAKTTIEPLLQALRDSDAQVRRHSAVALARFGKEVSKQVKPATASLVALLKDESADKRQLAAYVLTYIEPDPTMVVGPLRNALKDKAEGVRKTAGEALLKIDPDAAAREGIRK